ncbi:UNVERIFIED_CONTAM: hypothetical protein NCL1_32457 [Trichonephila clavipes]
MKILFSNQNMKIFYFSKYKKYIIIKIVCFFKSSIFGIRLTIELRIHILQVNCNSNVVKLLLIGYLTCFTSIVYHNLT